MMEGANANVAVEVQNAMAATAVENDTVTMAARGGLAPRYLAIASTIATTAKTTIVATAGDREAMNVGVNVLCTA